MVVKSKVKKSNGEGQPLLACPSEEFKPTPPTPPPEKVILTGARQYVCLVLADRSQSTVSRANFGRDETDDR